MRFMNREALQHFVRHTLPRFAREYRAEIIATIIALIGVFFLFEQYQLKQIIWDVLAGFGISFTDWLLRLSGVLVAFVASITISNVLGLVLIGVAAFIMGRRTRARLIARYKASYEACPRCTRALARSHRTWPERLLSRVLFIHIRVYRCTNTDCRWRGIRVAG